MLKIYLQIFGTIALCFILLLNYQVFGQKPMKAEIAKTQAEVQVSQKRNEVLNSIINFKPYFRKLEELQFEDYKDINIFFSPAFNEPNFMKRIQKMIDLSGCTTTGIKVGKGTAAKKKLTIAQFKTPPKEKENLAASIKAFVETISKQTKDSVKWQEIIGPTSDYQNRLMFYKSMGEGRKFPKSMSSGFEVHRFTLTLKGPYASCKKFLWLVSQNRPFTQVTVQSFGPVAKAATRGKTREGGNLTFSCRIIVMTVVDKNDRMPPTFTKGMELTTVETTPTTPSEPPKEGTLEQTGEETAKPAANETEAKPPTAAERLKKSIQGPRTGFSAK